MRSLLQESVFACVLLSLCLYLCNCLHFLIHLPVSVTQWSQHNTRKLRIDLLRIMIVCTLVARCQIHNSIGTQQNTRNIQVGISDRVLGKNSTFNISDINSILSQKRFEKNQNRLEVVKIAKTQLDLLQSKKIKPFPNTLSKQSSIGTLFLWEK